MAIVRWHLTEHWEAEAGPAPGPGDPVPPTQVGYRMRPPGATDPMVILADTKAELLAYECGRGTIGHALNDVNALFLHNGTTWRRWTTGTA